MRIIRAITRLQLALALGFMSIAVGLVPTGVQAVGYELGPRQGYAILVLAALFVVGALTVLFWPWIKEAWSWLRRDAELGEARMAQEQLRERLGNAEQEREESRQKNEELVAENQALRERLASQPSVPQNLTSEELASRHVKGKSFRLIDLVPQGDRALRGWTLENCDIYGPAVIATLAGTVINDCTWQGKGKADNILWDVSPNREDHIGVVSLENCTIVRCTLVHIGYLTTPEGVAHFKSQVGDDLTIGP